MWPLRPISTKTVQNATSLKTKQCGVPNLFERSNKATSPPRKLMAENNEEKVYKVWMPISSLFLAFGPKVANTPTLHRVQNQEKRVSESKNTHFPSPQKTAVWVRNPHFSTGHHRENRDFLTRNALFWGEGRGFSTPKPSFRWFLGLFSPVQGPGRKPKVKNSPFCPQTSPRNKLQNTVFGGRLTKSRYRQPRSWSQIIEICEPPDELQESLGPSGPEIKKKKEVWKQKKSPGNKSGESLEKVRKVWRKSQKCPFKAFSGLFPDFSGPRGPSWSGGGVLGRRGWEGEVPPSAVWGQTHTKCSKSQIANR